MFANVCYKGLRADVEAVPRDDYISRYKMTNFQRQDVVDDNMQLKCKMDSQKKPHLHKLKQKSDDGESEVK